VNRFRGLVGQVDVLTEKYVGKEPKAIDFADYKKKIRAQTTVDGKGVSVVDVLEQAYKSIKVRGRGSRRSVGTTTLDRGGGRGGGEVKTGEGRRSESAETTNTIFPSLYNPYLTPPPLPTPAPCRRHRHRRRH